MEPKLYSDLKILSAHLHEAVVELCERYPSMVNDINRYLTKEMIINNFLYSSDDRKAFQNLLEAQRIAQNEINELKEVQKENDQL